MGLPLRLTAVGLAVAEQVAERKPGVVLGAAMTRVNSRLSEASYLSRRKPSVGRIEHKLLGEPPFPLPFRSSFIGSFSLLPRFCEPPYW